MPDQHRPHGRRRHERDGDPATVVNLRHGDQLLDIARALAGEPDATAARADRIDHRGIDLAIDTPNGERRTRVEFDATLAEDEFPAGVRVAFVRLARRAHTELTMPPAAPPASS